MLKLKAKKYLLTDWVGSTMRHYGCVPHNWEYSLAGPRLVTGASCELLTLMFNCVRDDRDTDQPDHPDPATGQLDTCQAQKQNLPVPRPRGHPTLQ